MRKTKASASKDLAKKKADRYFSQYIRLRDSKNGRAVCCTCGVSTIQFDAGHFISRSYESTRYDEQNAHAQCLSCNRFKHGKQFEHSMHIDRVYGAGTADKIYIKSKMLCKRKHADYEWIAQEYKQKVDDLLKK